MKKESIRTGTQKPKDFLIKGQDFIGSLDNIIFGVENGIPFHNGKQDWSKGDLVSFFAFNAKLFHHLADKMEKFAEAVEKGIR